MPRRHWITLLAIVAVAVPGRVTAAGATTAAASAKVAAFSESWSLPTAGWDRTSSPTIADVNGDGVNDIVIGHQDGRLRVLSGADGRELPGWPQPVIVNGNPTAIDSTPAVADLFENGHKEIIVGVGSLWRVNQNGGVVVYNANGSRHCEFQTLDDGNAWTDTHIPSGYSEPVYSSVAIGDVDGDGYPDIVFGSFDRHIYAINRNCQKIMDYWLGDTVWSSPALYDADGDGRDEVFVGGDQSPQGLYNVAGGVFLALKWTPFGPGNVTVMWHHQIHDTFWSSPAIGNVQGNLQPDVVVGAGFFYGNADGHRVYAWRLYDGAPIPGWPVLTAAATMPSPALGDLEGNGHTDVAVSSADGIVRAYRGNGQQLWARQLTFNNTRAGGGAMSPIIADMNGDGHNDVGVGNVWGYFVLDGRNGAILSELNTFLSYESAGAVGNFGPAGWKLVVSGFDTPNYRSRLAAYSIPAPGVAPPWPMFRGGPKHQGGPVGHLYPPGTCRGPKNPAAHPVSESSAGFWELALNGAVFAAQGAPYKGGANGRARAWTVSIAPTHSGGGYYVLDGSGRIFPFGDARSYGSMAGHRLNAPIIALAPTPSGHGYWLLGRDGGIFGFGDARFHGSTGSMRLNAPIISMAATASGKGYWLLASDGGVFGFGDAKFHGSTGSMRLNAPITSMATAPSGRGYWLIARDGGVFSFGVPFYGSVPGLGVCIAPPVMQIRPTLTGRGYFILGANGRVYPFGDARVTAATPALGTHNIAVDLAIRP